MNRTPPRQPPLPELPHAGCEPAHGDLPGPLTGPLVAAVVYDGLCTFEYALCAELFGLPRPEMGPGWYRFTSVAVEEGPLRAQGGLVVQAADGLAALCQADVIIVPGWRGASAAVPEPLIRQLQAAHARGARLLSICSGAYVLAHAGLLDGCRATTHWRYADDFRQRFPAVQLDPDVLYVDEGQVMTSAGSAAGIDLLLHLVAKDRGQAAANQVARRLVMAPHRSGGQQQFIERPVPTDRSQRLERLMGAIEAALDRPWTLADMARHVHASPRSLQRHFEQSLGMSPSRWVIRLRIRQASHLLESTQLGIDQVAQACGFADAESLRRHFKAESGVTPSRYRERFSPRF